MVRKNQSMSSISNLKTKQKKFERKSDNKNRKILRKKNLRDRFLGATPFVIVTLSRMTIGRIVKKILEFRMNPSLLLKYFCKHL
jgi:hypothetical protein